MKKLFIYLTISLILFFSSNLTIFKQNEYSYYGSKVVYEGERIYSTYYGGESDSDSILSNNIITIELSYSDILKFEKFQNPEKNFINNNEKLIEKYSLKKYGSVVYSHYAPFIKLFIDGDFDGIDFINEMELDSNIRTIYLGRELIYEAGDYQNLYFPPIPGDDIVIDDGGGGGSSPSRTEVKVGIIDAGNIDTNISSQFTDVTIIEKDSAVAPHSHTSAIADIIVRIFNDNLNLIIYNSYVIENNVADIYAAVDWQISKSVDVINMSAGTNCTEDLGSYDSVAKFVDFIVEQYGITFIAASGNQPQSFCENYYNQAYVVSPAIGYNVIAVGGIDDENKVWGPSGYIENSIYLSKPNLVANYSNFVNNLPGTSNSTPRVTGSVAKLMSYYPSIKGNPSLVISLLHASSNPDTIVDDNNSYSPNGLKDMTGTGKLDYSNAYYIVLEEQYKSVINYGSNINNGVPFLTESYSCLANSRITVSFATLANMSYSNDIYDNEGFTEYKVELYRGTVKVKTLTINRTYGILRYDTPSSGLYTYTIKIYQVSNFPSSIYSEKISLSYKSRIY